MESLDKKQNVFLTPKSDLFKQKNWPQQNLELPPITPTSGSFFPREREGKNGKEKDGERWREKERERGREKEGESERARRNRLT